MNPEVMSGKYRAYPEYKDSGVDWAGFIPESWSVIRHKYIATFQKGKNPEILIDDYEEGAKRYLSMDYLRGNAASLYAHPVKNSYVSKRNQVLIIWDGSNAGEFVLAQEGIVSSTMAASELFTNINERYYWYLCTCLEPEMRKHANGMGIPHVDGNELKNSVLTIPSEKEAEKIVNFLDHETAKIDTLIEKQQQLIALLKEKRQAVISHAVTKGISSINGADVPMKNSGVEWLGDVPEHWGVKRLRYLGLCQNGINIGAEYFGSGYPFVSYGDAYKNEALPKYGSGLVESTEQDRVVYSVVKGDVIFTRTSETVEEIGFSSTCLETIEDATFAGFLIRFRPSLNVLDAGFSKYYFRNMLMRAFFIKEMNLVTRASLSQDLLKKLPVPLPPLDEQARIAEFLDNKSAVFKRLTENAEAAIELMQERRTALISAAVTGKIDVRNWQAPTQSEKTTEAS